MRLHGQAQADQMRMRTLIQNGIAEVTGHIDALDSSLSAVAKSGAYADLTGKPTLGALAAQDSVTHLQVSDWSSATSGFLTASSLTPYAKTANLSAVALSGAYGDLSGKPTIPTVPTVVSAFTNDAGYLSAHQDLTPVEIPLTDSGVVTYEMLKAWRTGHTVSVNLYFNLGSAISSWTQIAAGLPAPIARLRVAMSAWGTSYARPVLLSVETSGAIRAIYGKASTAYTIAFSYVTSET